MESITMEERDICCCGSGCWAKAIGWMEVVWHLLVTTLLSLAVLGVTRLTRRDLEDLLDRKLSHGEFDLIIDVLLVVVSFFILLSLLSVLMGGILLIGTFSRKRKLLSAWMVFAGIFLVLNVIGLIACAATLKFTTFCLVWAGAVVPLGFRSFFIWVVSVHKKEIETQSLLLHEGE